MSRVRRCAFTLLTSLTVLLGCAHRAPPTALAEETLKKHGLKIVGSLAVTETEAQIKSKLTEIRRLSRQWDAAVKQQKGTLSPEQRQELVTNINNQIGQLRSEMNTVVQQMNQLQRFRGRSFNSNAQQQLMELQLYRGQLQSEVNQESLFLNQLKSQPADPKAKDKIDADVRDRREAYEQALVDLRSLVDETKEKYRDLATNDDVKKALAALGKGRSDKPKLGPSHDFVTNAKALEKLEKAEAAREASESGLDATRHSGKTAKAAHPASAPDPAAKDKDKAKAKDKTAAPASDDSNSD